MQIADDTWHRVDTTTIWHCWHKAGILPQDAAVLAMPISALLNSINHDVDNELQNNPIINTECKVGSAIEELISTGVLQKENWMDSNALLNPAEEIHLIMEETSDEQIYQAVMDAWGALWGQPLLVVETRQSHWQRGNPKSINKKYIMKGISPGREEIQRESLGIPSASEPTLYNTSPQPGPSPGIPHWSWCKGNLTYAPEHLCWSMQVREYCPTPHTPIGLNGDSNP